MTQKDKTIAIVGLLILIAIGGIVLFGKKKEGPQPRGIDNFPHVIGPTTPPPKNTK